MFGKVATEQFKLTRVERPYRLELFVDSTRGSSGQGEYMFSYRIEPDGEESTVHLSGEIRGMTGLMASFGKLLVLP